MFISLYRKHKKNWWSPNKPYRQMKTIQLTWCKDIRSLTMEAAKMITQAFISCHLDYCNSLLYGISDSLLQCLQSVQNAAARLVTGTRWSDHITPVLRQLHWLPVRQRINFKMIAGWVFQARPVKHPPTSPMTAAWYQTRTVADSALVTLELVSPPERLCDSVTEVCQLLVLKFGTVTIYHLHSGLYSLDLTFDRFKWGLETYLFILVWWDLST